jgi:hypothetical protein
VQQLLQEAWRKLRQSGVLEQRNLEGLYDAIVPKVEAFSAALDARHASAVLRSCALEVCGAREVHPAQYKHCTGCKGVVYCSKEHQVADWPHHKAACKAARKAAAKGAGPSGSA